MPSYEVEIRLNVTGGQAARQQVNQIRQEAARGATMPAGGGTTTVGGVSLQNAGPSMAASIYTPPAIDPASRSNPPFAQQLQIAQQAGFPIYSLPNIYQQSFDKDLAFRTSNLSLTQANAVQMMAGITASEYGLLPSQTLSRAASQTASGAMIGMRLSQYSPSIRSAISANALDIMEAFPLTQSQAAKAAIQNNAINTSIARSAQSVRGMFTDDYNALVQANMAQGMTQVQASRAAASTVSSAKRQIRSFTRDPEQQASILESARVRSSETGEGIAEASREVIRAKKDQAKAIDEETRRIKADTRMQEQMDTRLENTAAREGARDTRNKTRRWKIMRGLDADQADQVANLAWQLQQDAAAEGGSLDLNPALAWARRTLFGGGGRGPSRGFFGLPRFSIASFFRFGIYARAAALPFQASLSAGEYSRAGLPLEFLGGALSGPQRATAELAQRQAERDFYSDIPVLGSIMGTVSDFGHMFAGGRTFAGLQAQSNFENARFSFQQGMIGLQGQTLGMQAQTRGATGTTAGAIAAARLQGSATQIGIRQSYNEQRRNLIDLMGKQLQADPEITGLDRSATARRWAGRMIGLTNPVTAAFTFFGWNPLQSSINAAQTQRDTRANAIRSSYASQISELQRQFVQQAGTSMDASDLQVQQLQSQQNASILSEQYQARIAVLQSQGRTMAAAREQLDAEDAQWQATHPEPKNATPQEFADWLKVRREHDIAFSQRYAALTTSQGASLNTMKVIGKANAIAPFMQAAGNRVGAADMIANAEFTRVTEGINPETMDAQQRVTWNAAAAEQQKQQASARISEFQLGINRTFALGAANNALRGNNRIAAFAGAYGPAIANTAGMTLSAMRAGGLPNFGDIRNAFATASAQYRAQALPLDRRDFDIGQSLQSQLGQMDSLMRGDPVSASVQGIVSSTQAVMRNMARSGVSDANIALQRQVGIRQIDVAERQFVDSFRMRTVNPFFNPAAEPSFDPSQTFGTFSRGRKDLLGTTGKEGPQADTSPVEIKIPDNFIDTLVSKLMTLIAQ